ncbi:hypothetical protein Tco_0547676 [Tanacetum coccineum]
MEMLMIVDVHLYRSILVFDVTHASNSDYARATLDRKSTTRGCQFLGNRLISSSVKSKLWLQLLQLKPKYVAAASWRGQANVNAVKRTWAQKLQQFSNSYHLRHCLSKGISQEVGTLRYLSLVVLLTKVGDEAVHKELGDRTERAATTASSLEAEQDSDTILGDVNAQTRFEITSIHSIDPPLSRGCTLGSGEDSMKLIGIDEIFIVRIGSSAVKRMLILPVQVSAIEVNPMIYTSCIEQFWATAKVQTVNGVRQIQTLVDKKMVIVMESSIRRYLHLDDAEGNMSTHKKIFVNPFHTKKVFANIKRARKDFSVRIIPLFDTMMVQPVEEMGEDSDNPTDSTPIPIIDQPSSSSQPKKDKPSKKVQRQEAEVPQDEAKHDESVPTPSNDPQASGWHKLRRMKHLKKRIQNRKEENTRPTGLEKTSESSSPRRVESSVDQKSLGVPEDASKQGRSIEDIDADVYMPMEAKVDGKDEQSTKKLDDSTTGEAVTTIGNDSVVPTTNEEITLAQTLIQIKAAKPKVVTTRATTTKSTRPEDKGVVIQEPSEFRAPQEIKPSSSKDNGKGIMVEPEVPLKRKDQIALDEQIARDIQAKLDAELLEEQKLARKQEEETNIALIESWENTQAMIEENKAKKEEGREEIAKGSRKKMLGRKRAVKEQQKESSKKLKVEEEKESEEVEEDDEVELKKLLVIKKDEDIAIDAIPLATKFIVIIDYKLHKKGMLVHYELIRADGSSKRYSSMIRMLQGIDREDLEALWRK